MRLHSIRWRPGSTPLDREAVISRLWGTGVTIDAGQDGMSVVWVINWPHAGARI